MNTTVLRTLVAAAMASTAITCAVAADFNGDGKQDIVWRLPSGNPLIWQMDGLAIRAQTIVPMAPDAGAAIVGAGRLFSRSPDAIVWVDSQHGVDVWRVDGSGNAVSTCRAAAGVDASWQFLGFGDVNGDGRDDVLWQLPNGALRAFVMNGCSIPQTQSFSQTPDLSWKFAGIGDLSGGHSAYVVWLDNTTAQVMLWSIGSGGAVTATAVPAGAQSGWQVSAIADFDGDGHSDLLWRGPSGELVLWMMNGTQHTVQTVTTSSPGAPLDALFSDGFETAQPPAPFLLSADFTILGAPDLNGDGDGDIVAIDSLGNVALLLMQGSTVRATTLIPPSPDMPYADRTGWRLPLDRPTVTKVSDQVSIDWTALAGGPAYKIFASANNDPASSGTGIALSAPPLTFGRNDSGYADKRYFAVTATYHGIELPPSPEGYIVEFAPQNQPWGAMAIADINGDGCLDILDAFGDCHGNFAAFDETTIGLGALRANNRQYRDIRFYDFNGDGVPDAIANSYSCDAAGCGGNDANSTLLLFFGNGDGTYTEDAAFSALSLPGGGFGETILVADFNNDGYLDIFLPKYCFYDGTEHNFLLINDGHGGFTDVADAAGVAMRNVNGSYRAEGAQALDINGDGWIDIYAGSHLLLNNGDLTFTNVGCEFDLAGVTRTSPWGLPCQFDEGAKFIDWNNSGQPALAINTVYGLRVFQFDGLQHFSALDVIPPIYLNTSFGLTAADVDGDGLTDLVVAGGVDQSVSSNLAYREINSAIEEAKANSFITITLNDNDLDEMLAEYATPNALPQLLVHRGPAFKLHDFYQDGLTPSTRGFNGVPIFADFDNSGTVDFVSRTQGTTGYGAVGGYQTILMNKAVDYDHILVSVLGANGERNQMGRIVRVSPTSRPSVVMTQIVDGGSGYLGNSPYDLTFATPYPGSYTITVRMADSTYTTTARIGEHTIIYANGVVEHQ